MKFYPFPAVAIPKQTKNGLIAADKHSLRTFWDEVDSLYGGEYASYGAGCYVFSIKVGGGELPWYVGLAEKQTFRKECFAPQKINHYNNAIANRIGTPYLTIIPRYSAAGYLCGPNKNGYRDVRELEIMLIGNCLTRNRNLLNLRDTKLLREMVVPGLLNTPPGKPNAETKAFKLLLGL